MFLLSGSTLGWILTGDFWEVSWCGQSAGGRAVFIIHIFLRAYSGDWRLFSGHLASAALRLRVKRSPAVYSLLGSAVFLLHIFLRSHSGDWRLSSGHLASALLRLRVKRSPAVYSLLGSAVFILHVFLRAYSGDWRFSSDHLASAALRLRVKQCPTIADSHILYEKRYLRLLFIVTRATSSFARVDT